LKPVVLVNDDGYFFGVEVYDHNQKFLYDVGLIKLNTFSNSIPSEASLKEGRFKNYIDDSQEFKVLIKYENVSIVKIRKQLLVILEWILNNISDYWSMDIEIDNIHDLKLNFSFSELIPATIFKFLFQNS